MLSSTRSKGNANIIDLIITAIALFWMYDAFIADKVESFKQPTEQVIEYDGK